MELFVLFIAIGCALAEEVRLLDLDPNEASQLIEQQDQTLKYAPKIDSNVPALRFLGNEQHQVAEDIYLANQYHGQDGLGGYLYGYSVPDIAKTEKKKAGGDLRGAYNYINGDGKEIKVEYWDDGTGFHQVDNLPDILPKQVEDTPEVRAAREEHFRIWQEQAERNSHAPEDPNAYANQNQQTTGQGYNYQQNQFRGTTGQPVGQHQPLQQGQSHYQTQHSQGSYSAGQGQPQPSGQYQGSISQSQGFGKGQGQGQGQIQSSGHFQARPPQGQYQSQATGQYQGTSQTRPQGQYQFSATQQSQSSYGQNLNNVDYSGQYSENRQVYSNSPSQKSNNEEEEEQGPPRGFFYKFDYPVGIIVQKDGGQVQKREDVNEIYKKNKEQFEQQLKAHGDYRLARSATNYPSYLYLGH